MKKNFFTVLLTFVTCAIVRAAPMNVIFILADDLGYGDLSCTGARSNLKDQFPRITAELREAPAAPLPARRGLPGFWHGIGILSMTGLAITGVLIFLVIPGGRGASSSSAGAAAFTTLSGVHREISYVAWVYWIGHVSAAILHQVRGDPVFRAIFWLRK